MHEDELESRLRTATDGLRMRTARCPDEHDVAAYVDGTLPTEAGERLEKHLADCDACLALVGFLSRGREQNPDEQVSELAVERARSLIRPKRGSWPRSIPQLAAAAAVMLAVSTLVVLQAPGPIPEADEAAPRQTRSATLTTGDLQVMSPAAGALVDPAELSVRWRAVPGSRYYEVRVLSEAGDLVHEERVEGTEWRPGRSIDLRAGGEYYVQVDAYPADSKSVSSEHVPFRIPQRR
jgi:hypothetical protein